MISELIIPSNVLKNIFSYIGPKHLPKLLSINKEINTLISSNDMINQLAYDYYLPYPETDGLKKLYNLFKLSKSDILFLVTKIGDCRSFRYYSNLLKYTATYSYRYKLFSKSISWNDGDIILLSIDFLMGHKDFSFYIDSPVVLYALRYGNRDVFDKLISKGITKRLIEKTARSGNFDFSKILIKNGVSIEYILEYAAKGNQANLIDQIINKYGNTWSDSYRDELYGKIIYNAACNEDDNDIVVKQMINYGVKNLGDSLVDATFRGNNVIVNLLVENGASYIDAIIYAIKNKYNYESMNYFIFLSGMTNGAPEGELQYVT